MKICLIGDSLTEGRPGVSFTKILEKKYDNVTFINLGKPGETVKSLHERITKTKLDTDYDLSFIWIGVNDVYSKLLSVQAQPAMKDKEEFREYFQNVLHIVLESSKQVVTVSPALVGENIVSPNTNEIRALSEIIESISSIYQNVSFLNLQSVFEKQLANVTSSDYIGTNVLRIMMDVLLYKNANRIDKLSKKRGLHYTLDGIHFNSIGAEIVAEEYANMIQRFF